MKKVIVSLLLLIFLCPTDIFSQAPSGLIATGFQTTVHLEWDEYSAFEPIGFNIYRSTIDGNFGAPVRRVGDYTDYTDYGLTPNTSYFYKIAAFDANGNESALSSSIAVSTNNQDYLKVASLDLLIPIYTGGMSADTPDNIKSGLEFARKIFFRNSKAQLNLKLTYMIIPGDPPPNANGTGDFATIGADLSARGILDNQYDAIHIEAIDIYGWYGGTFWLGQTGASMGYNWVSFDSEDHYSEGDAWLFTHEFGHTLDRLAQYSGYPEMIFNHYPWAFPMQPPIEFFDAGENFDAMGLVLELFEHHLDYQAPWDGYIEVEDADQDLLPDHDSRLPENEMTFGSSPLSLDTDMDGLSDFDEFMADRYQGSNPTSVDTDGDGENDGSDRYPVSNWQYEINKASGPILIDGQLNPDEEWHPMASEPYYSRQPGAVLNSYTTWDDDYLYFAFESNQYLKYYLMLDASGEDGVFQTNAKWEGGNYDAINSEAWGSNYFDAASLIIRADDTQVYLKENPILDSEIKTTATGNSYLTEVRIPHDLGPGFGFSYAAPNAPIISELSFSANDIIGIQVIARPLAGSNLYAWNDWRRGDWIALGEPFHYYDMVLKPGDNDPIDYCASTSEFPWHDWIAGVSVGSIENPSGKSIYSDFTNQSTNLIAGNSVPIELTAGYSYFTWDEFWTVWIDFNQDGILESPLEIAFQGVLGTPPNGTPEAVLNGNLYVPAWAEEGATRMRVSMTRNAFASPCQILDFGEVEDYTVVIDQVVNHLADLELSAAASPTSIQSGTVGFSLNVTNNGPDAATNIVVEHSQSQHFFMYSNVNASVGDFDPSAKIWIIPYLEAGEFASLEFDGLIVDMVTPQSDFFEIIASSVDDPDSTPNNDIGAKTPDEDDEAAVYLTPSNPADLIIANLSGLGEPAPAESFNLQFDLQNMGWLPANNVVSTVYLSVDNQLDPSDIPLANASPSLVGPMSQVQKEVLVTIPNNQSIGQYFILVFADSDHAVFEDNENNNVSSYPIEIVVSNPMDYCTSTSNFPWEDWISGVSIGTIENASGKSTYSNFTDLSTLITTGTYLPIELTTGFSYFTWDEYWTVWIDFNQNGIWESPDEIAFQGILEAPANGTAEAMLAGELFIPLGALEGQTRMRVSMTRGEYATPCQTLDFGEVEDYAVTIEAGGGPSPTEYCLSYSDFPWHEWISGVSVGSIDNTSGKSVYADFTGQTTDLAVGSTSPIELTTGFSYFTWDEYYRVWIDFNQDGVLESPVEIAFEGILEAPADGTPEAVLHGNIYIPSWALEGSTRMRVSMNRGEYATSCQVLEYGEVEDYSVNIVGSFSNGSTMLKLKSDQNNDWIHLTGLFNSSLAIVEVQVEKSMNGNDFSLLQKFEGEYSNGSSHSISVQDFNPIEGLNYYRPILMLEDGTRVHGAVIQELFELPSTFTLFPNPASDIVTISLKELQGANVNIQLVDQYGRLVKSLEIENVSQQFHSLTLNGILDGFYTVWVFPEGRKANARKLIVNKL